MSYPRLFALLFASVLFTAPRGADPFPDGSVRPNIIRILDDLGWTDLSCMGSQFYETLRFESPGRHTLTVQPVRKPGQAVMDLREVRLIPEP